MTCSSSNRASDSVTLARLLVQCVTETADVLGLSKQWFTGNGLKHKLSSEQQVSGGIAGDTGG